MTRPTPILSLALRARAFVHLYPSIVPLSAGREDQSASGKPQRDTYFIPLERLLPQSLLLRGEPHRKWPCTSGNDCISFFDFEGRAGDLSHMRASGSCETVSLRELARQPASASPFRRSSCSNFWCRMRGIALGDFCQVCECIRRLLLTGLLVFLVPDTSGQVAFSCVFAFAR